MENLKDKRIRVSTEVKSLEELQLAAASERRAAGLEGNWDTLYIHRRIYDAFTAIILLPGGLSPAIPVFLLHC